MQSDNTPRNNEPDGADAPASNPTTTDKTASDPTDAGPATSSAKRRVRTALLVLPIAAAGIGAVAVNQLAAAETEAAPAAASGTAPSTTAAAPAGDSDIATVLLEDARSLDGSGNNLEDPTLGRAGEIYTRVADANYADGVGVMVDGPAERYLSNRIFNGSNQNIFSENGVTHWGFVWGQFLDHTIGLRAPGDEDLLIGFDVSDPLEEFTNDLGGIATERSAVADGTGIETTLLRLT